MNIILTDFPIEKKVEQNLLNHTAKRLDSREINATVSNASYMLAFEIRKEEEKKNHEMKIVIENTKNILDHINCILSQQGEKMVTTDDFIIIEKSIENIDQISPFHQNSEIKKLVQQLYDALKQLDSNVKSKT